MFSVPNLELCFYEKVVVVTHCWNEDNTRGKYMKCPDNHCIYDLWIEDLFEYCATIIIETLTYTSRISSIMQKIVSSRRKTRRKGKPIKAFIQSQNLTIDVSRGSGEDEDDEEWYVWCIFVFNKFQLWYCIVFQFRIILLFLWSESYIIIILPVFGILWSKCVLVVFYEVKVVSNLCKT